MPVQCQIFVRGQARFGDSSPVTCHALFSGGDVVRAADHGNSAVACGEQVPGHLVGRAVVVAAHRICKHAVHEPIDEDEGLAAAAEALEYACAVSGGGDDEPVYAPAHEQVDVT